MSKLPFMRLYVSNLLGDTTTLSDAEFGSYVAILLAMWKAGGWLTLHQARKASRCVPGRWAKRWAEIGGYFQVEDDGRITHAWVREDLEDLGRSDDRRSKGVPAETTNQVSAGDTKSGAKPLKNNEPDDALTRAGARSQKEEGRSQTETPPSEQSLATRDPEDWPDGGVDVWVKKLEAVSAGKLDSSKDPGLTLTRSVLVRWQQRGFSFSLDVIPAVQALSRKAKRAVTSWSYFDGAVHDAYDGRTAPAPTTIATTGASRHDDKFTSHNANLARSRAAGERLDALYAAGGGRGGEFD